MVLALSVWNLLGFSLHPALNVVLAQTLLLSPWFTRGVFPILDRKRVRECEVARVFGAGAIRTFFVVEWPRVRGGVLRSLGTLLALSISEVTTVLLFSRGSFDSLASQTQNLFARFRLDEAAFGVMVILFISFGVTLFSEEVRA